MSDKYTVPRYLLPEEIWGLEACDFLAQYQQARLLWQDMQQGKAMQTVQLIYAPVAERSALRCLHTLSRCARFGGKPHRVCWLAPGELPLLPTPESSKPVLYLVHHASRFLNLYDWVQECRTSTMIKIVMTMPGPELAGCHNVPADYRAAIPPEEEGYARKRANEIIAGRLQPETKLDSQFDLTLQVLAEAGLAGVAVPLDLLAAFLHVPLADLRARCELEPISHFVIPESTGHPAHPLLRFRGRWLAGHLVMDACPGHYPLLDSLIEFIDPHEPRHRQFLLNYLLALKAEGFGQTALRLRQFHRGLIEACRMAAAVQETTAWNELLQGGLARVLRVLPALAGRHIRALVQRR